MLVHKPSFVEINSRILLLIVFMSAIFIIASGLCHAITQCHHIIVTRCIIISHNVM